MVHESSPRRHDNVNTHASFAAGGDVKGINLPTPSGFNIDHHSLHGTQNKSQLNGMHATVSSFRLDEDYLLRSFYPHCLC